MTKAELLTDVGAKSGDETKQAHFAPGFRGFCDHLSALGVSDRDLHPDLFRDLRPEDFVRARHQAVDVQTTPQP